MLVESVTKVYSLRWNGNNEDDIFTFAKKFDLTDVNIIYGELYIDRVGGYVEHNVMIHYIPEFEIMHIVKNK